MRSVRLDEALEARLEEAALVSGKPVSDIEFQQDGSGIWIPLTTTDQLLAVGDRNRTVTLQFRLALDWTLDVPGQYETDFTAKAARD